MPTKRRKVDWAATRKYKRRVGANKLRKAAASKDPPSFISIGAEGPAPAPAPAPAPVYNPLINLCERCGTYYLGSLRSCPICGLDRRVEF